MAVWLRLLALVLAAVVGLAEAPLSGTGYAYDAPSQVGAATHHVGPVAATSTTHTKNTRSAASRHSDDAPKVSWSYARFSGAVSAAKATGTAVETYFPKNAGFLGKTMRTALRPGQRIDRYGGSD